MVLRKNPLLLLLLLSIGFASCKKSGVVPNRGRDLVLNSFEQQKITADNAFTLRLFKNLDSANTGNANLFVSPLSVSFALGMTSNGANGQTLAAIKRTLNFNGLTQDQVNTYYNNLVTNLPLLDPGTTFNIANSIWYRQDFSVLPAFLQTNTNAFKAKVQALDFNSPQALSTINNWVSDQTKGKIPTIINDINGNDVMFLINAIYFKSSWKEKFDIASTKPQSFYLDDNSQVQAKFMNGEVDHGFYTDDQVKIVELPYLNSKYSMVILMPVSGTSLRNFVTGLDSAKWQGWMAKLGSGKSMITMPKFNFSYSALLNTPLTQLGMGIAFTDNADFTGINATGHLLISKVAHKATVEVDENGTTATAVTSVSIGVSAILEPPPIVIDHPFIFAIREMSSGLVIFAGAVHNPLK